MLGGEAEAAVLLREAHAGEPAVEQHPLQLAGAGDLGQLRLVALRGPEQPLDALGGAGSSRPARLRARSRKSSTLSIWCRSWWSSCREPRASAGQAAWAREGGDALAVVGGRAVGEPVDGDPAQVQVDVVLVGDADAAVQLHAVLDELGQVVAGVRLGRADRLGARRRRRASWRAAASASAWLASSHIFMSAKRCLISWYDASGRPNE